MKNKAIFFLFGILIIASLLRGIRLDSIPISPDWDEVSLGYNAYSIIQTGRDEYGKFLPVVLRSYDDYKPALYSYIAIPTIKLLGLNVFAVRLPSAILGVLAVLGTFLLVKELFKRDDLALLSAFLLAISPWHIQFSRVAFESNIGLTFNILAALFFLKGLKKPIFLIFSVALMALNLYVYQSEKVFTPLLLLLLITIFRKEIFSIPRKFIFLAITVGLIFSLPMLSFLLTNKNSLERAKGVSIFSQPYSYGEAQKALNDTNNNDKLGLIFDNRRVFYAKEVLSGYLSHFDFNWLFIRGDIARHHAPNMGLMYLFELPFLLIGIYSFFKKEYKKARILIFMWFLIAPIPASITSGVPHAIRTLNFLPTFQIFTALGIVYAFSVLKKYPMLFLSIIIFGVFNFVYYLDQYFVQQNIFNAKEWQYGYAKIIPEINIDKYKKIIVSNEGYMDQSYMFFLFYLKYPPKNYQKQSEFASGGFRENHKFGKFEFRPIVWGKEIKSENTIYIGKPSDFGQDAQVLKVINYPDGGEAMRIVQ